MRLPWGDVWVFSDVVVVPLFQGVLSNPFMKARKNLKYTTQSRSFVGTKATGGGRSLYVQHSIWTSMGGCVCFTIVVVLSSRQGIFSNHFMKAFTNFIIHYKKLFMCKGEGYWW